MNRIVVISFILCMVSCGEDKVVVPDDVIQKDEFIEILYEVEIVDAIHTQNASGKKEQNRVTLGYYQQIFNDFNITEKEFTHSYGFYEKHPELMLEIIDTLSNRFIILEDSISRELNNAKWRRKKR